MRAVPRTQGQCTGYFGEERADANARSRPTADLYVTRKRTFREGQLRDANIPSIEVCVWSMVGRGAGGEAGVAKAIYIIRKELEVSMALTGTKRVNEIGRHILVQ